MVNKSARNRKLFVTIILFMICSSTILSFPRWVPNVSGALQCEIELNVGCGSPRISPYLEYMRIELDDFYSSVDPGNPQLPFKTLDVLLPPNADINSITIQISRDESREMNITGEVAPSPPLACNGTVEWGVGKEISDGRNLLVYGRDEYYPDRIIEVSEVSKRGAYVFARIRYNPIQYNPLKGRLRIHEKVTFKVTYVLNGQRETAVRNTIMENIAAKQFVNWNTAKEWYSQTFLTSNSQYDYIIVTTNAIRTGSSELNNYVNYLQNIRGFKVKIITEDDYGSATGQQRAINIRNWLKNNYQAMGIKYVLLIGNPDPDDPSLPSDSFGDVPMMMCWPRAQGYNEAPTDYFYADLTGNWNTDNDQYYGEYGQDTGVDFTPEVYVGRIPVYDNDYTTLDKILRKTMNYASSETDWRHRIMLPMAISNFKNEDNSGWPATNGTDLPKYVIENLLPTGWSHYVLYEGAGLAPMPPDTPYYSVPLTRDNVVNEWKNGYGVVSWWGHGSTFGAYRIYWSYDDGDGIPESSEITGTAFFDSWDAPELNDSKPSFTFQCSCTNGYPESNSNLGYALLKNGAVTTVSASRVSWYIIGYWQPRMLTDNAEIGYRYVEKLIKDRLSAGVALYEAKQELKQNPPYDDPAWWMNLFDFNLYGDPSISLFSDISEITVDSDPQGSGFVKVDGQPVTTPTAFIWEEGSTHLLEAISPIYLENGERYAWYSWSDGGAQSHNYIVPSSNTTVTAFFKKQYNVTFTVKPPSCGTVTPSGSGWYNESSTIQISAIPDPDCVFRNWFTNTSEITIADPNSPDTTATINGPGTVTANFTVTVTSLALRLVNSTVQAGVVNLTVKIISPNNITGAEYAVDDTNFPTVIPSPLDGTWDSNIEYIRISFNGSAYANGYHTVYIRASDTQETSDWLTVRFHVRDLVRKYNLIALIFRPSSEYSAKDVAEAIGVNAVNHIDMWNSTSQKYESYVPSAPKPKNFLMEEGYGYFMFLTSPARFIEVEVNGYG
ncbi:MAG: C25 family cysteine peptidase [Thermoproteota archaeon]